MRTQVGYVGGHTPNPTYHSIGDHAEGVEVEFDPRRISREALLDEFWSSHDPRRPSRSSQYRAALFCADEAELEVA